MSNPSKAKGTAGESAVVKLFRNRYGFPELRARRVTLNGNYDLGDVHAEFPSAELLCIEVKAGKMADSASLADIDAWVEEARLECKAAHASRWLLVVKRRGYAPERVEKWRAFFAIPSPGVDRDVVVEMPLHEAIEWLSDEYGRYQGGLDILVA